MRAPAIAEKVKKKLGALVIDIHDQVTKIEDKSPHGVDPLSEQLGADDPAWKVHTNQERLALLRAQACEVSELFLVMYPQASED